MATKFCTNCGGEFIASVEICPDCELELVDERPEAVADADGHIEYELHEWAGQSRAMIEQLLEAERIPRAWEGTDLVVPAAYEARVDALLEQVEVTERATLDPDAPKVAYDIDDWSDARQTELMAALDEREVPHEFAADGALIVLEEHETIVESIIDALEAEDGDDDDDEDDDGVIDEDDDLGGEDDDDDDDDEYDGPEAMDVMSDLFVAADRLMHSATDAEAVLSMVERADDAARMPLPYGFDRTVWRTITAQATGLKAALEGDDTEDETIQEQAKDLRATLRSYV